MTDMEPPEVRVYRQKMADRRDPMNGVVYSDSNMRVWQMWDAAATPERGRWRIRIDLYD